MNIPAQSPKRQAEILEFAKKIEPYWTEDEAKSLLAKVVAATENLETIGRPSREVLARVGNVLISTNRPLPLATITPEDWRAALTFTDPRKLLDVIGRLGEGIAAMQALIDDAEERAAIEAEAEAPVAPAPANDAAAAPKAAPKTGDGARKAGRSSRAPSPEECVRLFRDAMDAAGLSFKGPLRTDDGLHRFHVDGDHKGSLNGWYFLHTTDGWPNGQAGSWRLNGDLPVVKWVANGVDGKGPTPAETKAMRKRQEETRRRDEEKRAEVHAEAAERTRNILKTATDAPADHPYLVRKGVKSYGLKHVQEWVKEWVNDETGEVHRKVVKDALLVPMQSTKARDVSLQAIFPSKEDQLGRDKDFLSGGQKKGCYFVIGRPEPKNGREVIVIVEGYATGASIYEAVHEAIGAGVIVAFDAGNLKPVAEWFREKRPDATIIIAGDNDLWTDKPVRNPGATRAREAALAVNGRVALPVFDSLDGKPTDFNDLHVRGNLEVVRHQIIAAADGNPELAPDDPSDPQNLKAAKGIDMLGGGDGLADATREALAAEREARAKAAEDPANLHFEVKGSTILKDSQINVRVALKKLGVTVSYDEFAKRLLYRTKGNGENKHLDDSAVIRMWLTTDQEFKFRPGKDFFFDVVEDAARGNSFHPVRQYLNVVKWDNVERIDKWLTTYGGVEENAYTRAVGALTLVAAVRRVRQPGCKFDEMLLLITEAQGKNKSSALKVLAGEEWFTDSFPLDADDKLIIEQSAGKWIVEAGELKGMREAESIKQLLSKQVDRARMAYGRMTTETPRQFIVIGTSNKGKPLTDPTGNRRFWPIDVVAFDVDALRRDRDQLWAEAAHREAQGASIRLPENLWAEAGRHQEAHRAVDPWFEVLAGMLGKPDDDEHLCGKIRSEDAWSIIGLPPERREQKHNERFGAAMRQLKFEQDRLRFGGKRQYCYWRGGEEAHNQEITVETNGNTKCAFVKKGWEPGKSAAPASDEIPF